MIRGDRMKNKRLIRGISAVLVFAMILTCFANVNFESRAEDQVIDRFYVLDENGNPVSVEITQGDVENSAEPEKYTVEISNETEQEVIGEYDDLEEANETYQSAVEQSQSANTYTSSARSKRSVETAEGQDISLLDSNGNLVATTKSVVGVVRFARNQGLIYYKELDTGRQGYLSGSSVGDAAYIRTDSDGVVCKVSGVTMKVEQKYVASIDTYSANQKVSYYSVSSDGYLIHTFTYYSGSTLTTSSTRVGYQPSYLEKGKTYYSYDGHYFYTSFSNMISDYQNGTYGKAVNVNNPYYNYYQYLSFHTTAPFTGSQYDSYVTANKSNSVMSKTGNDFVNTQNKYTINSLMMFGVAINESAWGTSNIAKTKNNLFGLDAVDSNPNESADKFSSLAACIEDFAYGWMHTGYLDGMDSRYRGPHLGDKHSGINVKYASDPYWGEKAAARGYYFDTAKQDYGRYTIGIAKSGNINFYKEASTSSTRIYTSEAGSGGNLFDFPVVILGKETGANGTVFYKVISDISLTDDRNGRNVSAVFNPYRDYLYVKASDINIVFNGSDAGVGGKIEKPDDVVNALFLSNADSYLTGFSLGGDVSSIISRIASLGSGCSVSVQKADGTQITNGTLATGMTMTITVDGVSKSYTVVIRGDVSGDGKLSAIDYVKVRNYLDGSSSLKDAFLKGADTSGDSKVTAIDYVKLRNHLDNKSTISQY